ncbi:MAG: UvrD-helicase domain-containing protein [Clostridia bacterium]|nr:UvrD-helicase domain-containing protein [Clostridia bacterium]
MSDLVKLTMQQNSAINHDKGNLIVSASAGSGKTHVIIERIIRLVRDKKVSVSKILAVTFTRLAAEEMKDKLKKALINEFNKTGDLYFKNKLSEVSVADISTIHSFLSNLLRTYFYAIDLDATFEVLDERRSNKIINKAIDELFEELYENSDSEFLQLLTYYSSKRKDKKLKEIIIKLYEFSRSEDSLDALEEKSKNHFVNSCNNAISEEGNVEYIKTLSQNGVETIKMLFNLTKKFEEKYTLLKQEENGIDFSDIEFLALKLFKKAEILEEIKNKYEYIFVDEYQDVNSIQEQLIVSLSCDNAFMVGDSKQSIYGFRGCNPSYFINKFNTYNQGNGGKAISLDKNFRSAKKIIDAVNNIFSNIMTKTFGEFDYASHPMIYGEGYLDYEGRAVMHVIEKQEKIEKENIFSGVYSVVNSVNDDNKIEFSSEELAVIKVIKDVLGKNYYDVKTKTYKSVEYKDICILIRSLKGFGENLLKALLYYDIPVSSGIKNEIASYPEVKVLYSVVKAICFMQSDVDLATVMLNFYNFTEDDLAVIRTSGDRYSTFYECFLKALDKDGEIFDKVRNFYKWFNEIRLLSEYMPASELLRKIISDTEWELKILSSNHGKEKLSRVERFISEVDFTSKPMTVYEFNEYLNSSIDTISFTGTESDDTVKIMTAHASKGLEFPIVIVAGTSKQFNSNDVKQDIYMDRKYGVAVKSYDVDNMTVSENPAINVIKEEYKRNRAIEEIRLFYVELTRAKCELHIIVDGNNFQENRNEELYLSANKQRDFLSLNDMEWVEVKSEDLNNLREQESEVSFVAGKSINREVVEKIKENLSFTYAFSNDINLPLKSSVSKEIKSDEYYKITNIFGESDSETGSAYHKYLELCSFNSENIESEINEFKLKHLMTDREISLIDTSKIKSILSMPIFKEIKGKKVYKERKFYQLVKANELGYTSEEKILIQGVIDLIVEDDTGVTLIDYKLSKIESEEDLVNKYKKQLYLYKKAIEESLSIKVNKTYIVNILQEKIIPIDGI